MSWRSLLTVPLLAVVVAVVVLLLELSWLVAVLLALALGTAAAAVLFARSEGRFAAASERVAQFAAGSAGAPVPVSGSAQWRRLATELNAVGAFLAGRLAELESERARVGRVLDELPPAVLLFTRERLTYANRSARVLFGVERAEPRTPFQVLGIEGLARAVTRARREGEPVEVEAERDGRILVARAVRSGEEILVVVSDVTELRRLDAVRADFVTNTSHELKTPVAGMLALADSLGVALERHPERARRMVALLQREAARLAQLVRELLDLSRLEEPEPQAVPDSIDLAALVRDEAERVTPLAQARNVTVTCDISGPLSVAGTKEDLRLVVANLLENAVQYNRDGGSVRVTAQRRDGTVAVVVSDRGIGIPEADRDRIFERFYRVDKARSRAAGGTGLGLSIVRHALQRLGGDVTVDSVLGEGTTFTVTLPPARQSHHTLSDQLPSS